MANSFTKGGFDLGIVTTNGDEMLEFYRDVIGLEFEATLNMEALGVAAMHRVWANESLLKIVVPTKEVAPGASGGMMALQGCVTSLCPFPVFSRLLMRVPQLARRLSGTEEKYVPA